MTEAYIVAALRTAGGRRNGQLSGWHPVDLAAQVLDALIARTGCDPALVEDVILGCVSQAGQQSVNIARNAVLASGLPESVPATTLDRQCGSSQQALHFAAQAVLAGTMDVVIAGGIESMSRVPMGMPTALPAREGLGDQYSPQLLARYPGARFSQFNGAEMLAEKHHLTRDLLDAYALQSHQRAAAATRAGWFDAEILPLPARLATDDGEGEGEAMHSVDEGIRFDSTLAAIASVKPLREGGRLSAASASQICDGASGVMVVNERGLRSLGVAPLARIHQMTVVGGDPVIMLEAPIDATRRALAKAGLTVADIDLYEINEAFASVPLSWQNSLDADPARLNVAGGAIALGHPLGASGTRLMATLVHGLRRTGGRYGLQAMCEGGGMANATVVERL